MGGWDQSIDRLGFASFSFPPPRFSCFGLVWFVLVLQCKVRPLDTTLSPAIPFRLCLCSWSSPFPLSRAGFVLSDSSLHFPLVAFSSFGMLLVLGGFTLQPLCRSRGEDVQEGFALGTSCLLLRQLASVGYEAVLFTRIDEIDGLGHGQSAVEDSVPCGISSLFIFFFSCGSSRLAYSTLLAWLGSVRYGLASGCLARLGFAYLSCLFGWTILLLEPRIHTLIHTCLYSH